ncbi:MAG TPA: HAMP domain-containing sensor histidine kinase [Candidatus Binatia bacterium]|nr:HAMP domain-containing sensor histidine kinase [Candidatus Binatia bacterium]
MTDNIVDLMGLEPRMLLGSRTLWDEWVLPEDSSLVLEHFNNLKIADHTSVIHRLVDRRGLPVWVANGIRKVRSSGAEMFCGCLTPLGRDNRASSLDQNVVAKFVHKMGNHFQVLNLVINSLPKSVSEPGQTTMVQETVDRALELTRSLSEYTQVITCFVQVDFFDILRAAVMTRRPLFLEKGVVLDERIQETAGDVTMLGDPFLLELAIGHILQNALEGTDAGGLVTVYGSLETYNHNSAVVKLRVVDTGCGIKPEDLPTVIFPFVTSKKNHDGLGLSIASRFIEMHGGLLRITSKDGLGTEAEISLPVSNSDGFSYL